MQQVKMFIKNISLAQYLYIGDMLTYKIKL